VRFHLHPDVEVSRDGRKLLRLRIPGEDAWLFSADVPVYLEDSIYFSGLSGPDKTSQIMLVFRLAEKNEVKWVFRRYSRTMPTLSCWIKRSDIFCQSHARMIYRRMKFS